LHHTSPKNWEIGKFHFLGEQNEFGINIRRRRLISIGKLAFHPRINLLVKIGKLGNFILSESKIIWDKLFEETSWPIGHSEILFE